MRIPGRPYAVQKRLMKKISLVGLAATFTPGIEWNCDVNWQQFFARLPKTIIDWLPREDWRPVLKAVYGNAYLLRNLAEKARTKGLNDLACDFDHTMSLICSETWSVEKAPKSD